MHPARSSDSVGILDFHRRKLSPCCSRVPRINGVILVRKSSRLPQLRLVGILSNFRICDRARGSEYFGTDLSSGPFVPFTIFARWPSGILKNEDGRTEPGSRPGKLGDGRLSQFGSEPH